MAEPIKNTQSNFAEGIQKKENISEQLKNQPKSIADKVPFSEILRYTIYTISFIIIVDNHAAVQTSFTCNYAFINQFINQYEVNDDSETLNLTKIKFDSISVLSEVVNFTYINILDGIYDEGNGFYYSQPVPFQYFVILSPLRIIQKRAILTAEPTGIVPYRWGDDQSNDNITSYGPNNTFIYSPNDGGFALNIPVTQLKPNDSRTLFMNAINAGFIDNITKSITVDLSVYNSIQNTITYLATSFTVSRSGRIASTDYSLFTIKLNHYSEDGSMFRLLLEILFGVLFAYYFVSEFIKIYRNVKKAIQYDKINISAGTKAQKAAEAASKGLRMLTTTVKALLSYVRDVWTFLDVSSLIFSLIVISTWLKYISNDPINKLINEIPYQDGKINANLTESQADAYFNLNNTLNNTADTFQTYYKICALNAWINILKLLRYATKYVKPLRDLVNILIATIDKIAMFLIILITILLAFVFFAHFYYGTVLEDFSTVTGSIIYLVGNLDLNFNQIDNMLAYDTTVSFLFNLLFIFFVNFILCNMFLIYTVDEYRKYKAAQKKEQAELEYNNDKEDKEEIHPILAAWYFINKKVLMKILKFIWKKKYYAYQEKEAQSKKLQERELYIYQNFNYDLNIQDTFGQKENKNTVYNNEANILRDRARENMKLVTIVWKTIGLIALATIYIYISIDHQDTTEGNLMIQSAISTVNGQPIGVPADDESVDLIRIKNTIQLQMWLNTTLKSFFFQETYDLETDVIYSGIFLSAYNYLLTNGIRATARYNTFVNNTLKYQKLSLEGLTPSFAADENDPYGEFKGPITNTLTNITYYYQADGGYKSNGGYVWILNLSNWVDEINTLFNGDVWGDNLNTLVLELPIYQILTDKYMVLTMIFTLSDANSISETIGAYTIDIYLYDTAGQRFRGFLEICFVAFIISQSYFIAKSIRKKLDNYKIWYSLYIESFPELMKTLRQRKKPELIRKLEYVLDFGEMLDIFNIAILLISLIAWGLYIILTAAIIIKTNNHFSGEQPLETTNLLSFLENADILLNFLQISNSITCIVFCIKVLYYYSFNKSFYVITETIKKSFAMLPFTAGLLLAFFLAYSFLLNWIEGPLHSQFLTISSSFVRMMQILSAFQDFDMNLIKQDSSSFLAYLYFFPFVLIINYTISNIFLGVCYEDYIDVKTKMGIEISDNSGITIKEFLRLTYMLLRPSKHEKERTQKVEINEQYLESFDPRRVFEEFRETMSQHGNFKDVKLWVAMCTKNIMLEYDTRKIIKRMCKEVAFSYVNEMNNPLKNKVIDYPRKLKEYSLREKYWNYYRVGSYQLLKFMTSFTNKIKELEELIDDPKLIEEKKKEREKIKAYIVLLEEEIEKNLQELNKMRLVLNDYDRIRNEEHIIDNKIPRKSKD